MDLDTKKCRWRCALRRTSSSDQEVCGFGKGKHNTLRWPSRPSNKEPQKRSRSQTSLFTTDLGTLQQWRSIQASYRLEIQRLQNRINFIIEDISKEEPGAAGRQSTVDLQNLQARIGSITRDMGALDRSCSAETAMGFLPASHHRSPQPCPWRSAGGLDRWSLEEVFVT